MFKKLLLLFTLIFFISLPITYWFLLSPSQRQAETEIFIISSALSRINLARRLEKEGFVKKAWIAEALLTIRGKEEIGPGGYRVSKQLNAWELIGVFAADPDLVWVTIPEGWRKEQIGERLAKSLGWDHGQLSDWIQKYTALDFDHLEGVYFPDTYLIPKDEDGLSIANRLRGRFEEKFAPYYQEFLAQDIKWTTGLTLASIIQREAAGDGDMNLIAGILWNRLLEGMRLEVDATVAYVRDDVSHYGLARNSVQPLEPYKSEGGWWAPIKPEDKDISSAYNTYRHEGLPPHPICNPSLAAIEAVLNPQETDCFYYLHDSNREIHGAVTYEEHLENIENYLRL